MEEGSELYVEDKNGKKYTYQRIISGSYMTSSSTEVRDCIAKGLIVYPLVNKEVVPK